MDTSPITASAPAPAPAPAPGFLASLYAWITVHWRTSLGTLGVLAEVASQIATRAHIGPAWVPADGHVAFLFLVAAGFISAGDAKKVTDLEAALNAVKLQMALQTRAFQAHVEADGQADGPADGQADGQGTPPASPASPASHPVA
jgi:hypothetical protein